MTRQGSMKELREAIKRIKAKLYLEDKVETLLNKNILKLIN